MAWRTVAIGIGNAPLTGREPELRTRMPQQRGSIPPPECGRRSIGMPLWRGHTASSWPVLRLVALGGVVRDCARRGSVRPRQCRRAAALGRLARSDHLLVDHSFNRGCCDGFGGALRFVSCKLRCLVLDPLLRFLVLASHTLEFAAHFDALALCDRYALVQACSVRAGGVPLCLGLLAQLALRFQFLLHCLQLRFELGNSRLIVCQWRNIRRRIGDVPPRLLSILVQRLQYLGLPLQILRSMIQQRLQWRRLILRQVVRSDLRYAEREGADPVRFVFELLDDDMPAERPFIGLVPFVRGTEPVQVAGQRRQICDPTTPQIFPRSSA
ncbi:hypothetical protein OJJOAM_000702 [Cupriavidus sp. H18C1]